MYVHVSNTYDVYTSFGDKTGSVNLVCRISLNLKTKCKPEICLASIKDLVSANGTTSFIRAVKCYHIFELYCGQMISPMHLYLNVFIYVRKLSNICKISINRTIESNMKRK